MYISKYQFKLKDTLKLFLSFLYINPSFYTLLIALQNFRAKSFIKFLISKNMRQGCEIRKKNLIGIYENYSGKYRCKPIAFVYN